MDAEGGDGGGEALVLVDQQDEFDEAAVVVVRGQEGPGLVVEVAGPDYLVDGGEQGSVLGGPVGGGGPRLDAGEDFGVMPARRPRRMW